MIEVWKRRMKDRMAPVSYFKIQVMVRAFYLDPSKGHRILPDVLKCGSPV